jgi:hypothetical protein
MAQSHVLDLCIFCDFFVEFRKRREEESVQSFLVLTFKQRKLSR